MRASVPAFLRAFVRAHVRSGRECDERDGAVVSEVGELVLDAREVVLERGVRGDFGGWLVASLLRLCPLARQPVGRVLQRVVGDPHARCFELGRAFGVEHLLLLVLVVGSGHALGVLQQRVHARVGVFQRLGAAQLDFRRVEVQILRHDLAQALAPLRRALGVQADRLAILTQLELHLGVRRNRHSEPSRNKGFRQGNLELRTYRPASLSPGA
eukprot:6199934-Pleurochrysis_carterae.AAC.3